MLHEYVTSVPLVSIFSLDVRILMSYQHKGVRRIKSIKTLMMGLNGMRQKLVNIFRKRESKISNKPLEKNAMLQRSFDPEVSSSTYKAQYLYDDQIKSIWMRGLKS